MGLADTVTKAYMKENTVFADAFNYLIYGGKTVVNPTQLKELDTTEIALPFGAQNENRTQPDDAVQKYRDVLKSAVIKQDGEAAYILLGIENQTDIHYAMPVRNIIYDALQYGKQVADIAAKHRTDGSKGHTGVSTCPASIRTIRSHLSLPWCCTLERTSGMARCLCMK